ncbi:hypothetical protein DACRYDRAFT_25602 [Dacryopinax primogenitus]|uniref:Uncharacterized protein n=1 Tax=Dacryopinax primogenitus (strain DJM 731) TaxID=1858805 RepID=M5FNU8_DACPD|nr:uncharacterized protein DACRYDRAFT_25602 [Dacryopinax primogenitus]EJT96573.1 hypothetical protein DACRYDRAFT_25602 [Dacryopinax primogenitus]
MMPIPRSPLATSATKLSSPRFTRTISTVRPSVLQLRSPSDPAIKTYYGHLPSILSPTLLSPPLASPPSPAFALEVRSPRLGRHPDIYSLSPHTPSIASLLSPARSCLKGDSTRNIPDIDLTAVPASPERTVTQATFQAAEMERREQRPQIKLQTEGFLQAPFMSPTTPRSGRTPRSTRTPKHVAISPIVLVANEPSPPNPMSALTRKLEKLQVHRMEADEEAAGDKYTLGMRRGTPVTTPCVERFEDAF